MSKELKINVDAEYLKTLHLHIAVPCYAGQCYESVMMSLVRFGELARQCGLKWTIETLTNESLITRGRNTLTAKFLAMKEATHLMFIDSDIGFSPEQIIMLLMRTKDPEIKLIGCGYPMKALPLRFVINGLPGAVEKDGLLEVSKLGTGFMLIAREVFDVVKQCPRVEQYNNDIGLDPMFDQYMYNFWDCAVINKRYLSEDWLFCEMYRDFGGKVWLDTRTTLSHTGTYNFNAVAQNELFEQIKTLIK
jgi:hypothetical protein